MAMAMEETEASLRHCPLADGIPVVDLDLLVNGTADERLQAIQDIGRACRDWGLFMVINHGVPEALREAVMATCKELFDLPPEEKAEYLEAAPMDPIRIGSGFNAVVDGARFWRDYVKMFAHPEFHCPAKPMELRDIAAEYAIKTRHMLLQLATAISGSLGLDGGRLSEALNLESCFHILVGNHYPPYAGRDGGDVGIGLPAHSDHGLLTLLHQNGVDGLEVEHGGRWLLARPLPGAFFLIAGDQLEIVTNGRYRAPLHRAVVGRKRARMSFLSLISPCLDAVVEPLPEQVRDGRGREFRGVRYGDYLARQQSTRLNGKAALDMARVTTPDC
ncbi:hypothetical protein ACP4OV_017719 [Aristida adscensionis]